MNGNIRNGHRNRTYPHTQYTSVLHGQNSLKKKNKGETVFFYIFPFFYFLWNRCVNQFFINSKISIQSKIPHVLPQPVY